LTWTEREVHILDKDSLEILETFAMWPSCKTGWGITKNDAENVLYVSDSSAFISVIDATTLQYLYSITVKDKNGRNFPKVNELEFIYGYIWGNVFGKNTIVKIDPSTGYIVKTIDLEALTLAEYNFVFSSPDTLTSKYGYDFGNNVINGIAYDFENDDMYVTGKRWNMMFKLKVTEVLNDSMYHKSSVLI
jgi:glutaminyl-peptide cyclotransferase